MFLEGLEEEEIMPCNLNFNQCNLGCGYPRPIFTCRNIFNTLFQNESMNIIVQ